MVLVLAPHPDDEVFGPGGTLALHAAAGGKVVVALLTAGEQHPEGSADAGYAERRLAESAAALACLGLDAPECWHLPDRGVCYGEALIARVMARITALDADLVYAPSPWEAHPDHRATAMAAMEAVRRLGGARQLACYEISAPLRPTHLIDISPVAAAKQAAMAAFVSQQALHPYADCVSGLNRYRTLTLPVGVTEAEAFERHTAAELARAPLRLLESAHQRQQRQQLAMLPTDLPLISVLVRTLGRPTLQRTLDSIAAQTHPHVEVVLIDAGGDLEQRFDGVLRCADFPVRVVAGALAGQRLPRADAANRGLMAAQGEYLIFLDDDDWFYPDHLAKLLAALQAQPGVLAAHTAVVCANDAGEAGDQVFDFAYAPRELCYGNFLPIHAVLFAAALRERGCRFDPAFDLYEDWDFWLQVEQHTAFVFVPGVSAAYRINALSGAGVATDPQQAAAATAALYAKWQVLASAERFAELVTRSLQRRALQAQVLAERETQAATLAAERQAAAVALSEWQARAAREQQAAATAAAAADAARQQAHDWRVHHDAACTARDRVQGALDAAQQRIDALIGQTQQWAIEVGVARQGADQARQSADQARLDADQRLREAQQLRQALDAVHASTSWRVSAPVRGAGRALRKLRTLARTWGAARQRGMTPRYILQRSLDIWQREGLNGLRLRASRLLHPGAGHAAAETLGADPDLPDYSYGPWTRAFDTPDAPALADFQARAQALAAADGPTIAIVMPVYNPAAAWLEQAIASVEAQCYPKWQLCIVDDASPAAHVRPILEAAAARDARIRVHFAPHNGHISKATNAALALVDAACAWVGFLDHDDELRAHAVLRMAESIVAQPQGRLFYSDEDKLDAAGQRVHPYFKPDFNLGLLRAHNCICHFAVYQRALLDRLGGVREGYEGAQDYDLSLRAVDALSAAEIIHLPEILYHWRITPQSTASGHQTKNYAFAAGQRALAEHLQRRGLTGEVLEAPEASGMYRIRFARPDPTPLVSIVIPTRNGLQLLRQCFDSLQQTAYPNYEVLVVDNGSDDAETLTYLGVLAQTGRARVLRDDGPFNFSALNNRAVEQAAGEFVLLMNNDIEITHPEWLDEMVGPALETGVGCVGARLWYPDGRLQHAGVILVCGVAGHAHKYLARGQHGYMGRAVLAQDFVGVTAACLLVRKAIYQEVGGLDESLAVAFNDVDFCLRVHHAGYRNHWTPYAELIHHESVTRGYEDTPAKQARFRKEIELMQRRWGDFLRNDPCYNPNLTYNAEDFSLAWPPRHFPE